MIPFEIRHPVPRDVRDQQRGDPRFDSLSDDEIEQRLRIETDRGPIDRDDPPARRAKWEPMP